MKVGLSFVINRTFIAFSGGKGKSVCREELVVRGPRMINNPSWKAAVAAPNTNTLPVHVSTNRFSRFLPVRFVHLKCHFDVTWPVFGFSSKLPSNSIMAPRNLHRMEAANSDFRKNNSDDSTDCTSGGGKFYFNVHNTVKN